MCSRNKFTEEEDQAIIKYMSSRMAEVGDSKTWTGLIASGVSNLRSFCSKGPMYCWPNFLYMKYTPRICNLLCTGNRKSAHVAVGKEPVCKEAAAECARVSRCELFCVARQNPCAAQFFDMSLK